jgi:hypothetical protein
MNRTMTRHLALVLALLILSGAAAAVQAQDDFLTDEEVTAIRDAQEPEKRIVAYLDFAQWRLDAVRASLASAKGNFGRAVQRNLTDYARILEALESTLFDSRERRSPVPKALKAMETRVPEFLKYLESLNPNSPGWKDYEYTLEEASEVTQEVLAEAAKGNFPEVDEREPPRLPPPSAPRRAPEEEGPPRKGRPTS